MALNVLLPGLVGLASAAVGALQGRSVLHRLWIRQLESRFDGMARDATGARLRIVRDDRVLVLEGGQVLGPPELRTQTRVRLPPGFALGPPRSFGDDGVLTGDWRLDPHFDVRGGPAWWVRALLVDAAVNARLSALVDARPPVRVRGGVVQRAVVGRPVESFLEELEVVDGLARDLGEAAVRTWAARSLRPGLGGDGPFRLVGRPGGVPVRLVWEAGEGGGAVVLDAAIPGVVPPDLRVAARQPGQSAGVPLLDPVLDRHVVARGAAPDALRRLLCREGVRGPLLALLHEAPGAQVQGPRVRVRTPGPTPDTALASLAEAVDLAAALGGGAEATVG